MPKVGAWIESILKKAGVDTTTEDLKTVLAVDTDIPEEATKKADSALMTIAAAKIHPDIAGFYRQQNFSTFDQKMNDGIIEHGLTMDEAFANEKSTPKKFDMYQKALQEKLSKGKSSDATKEEWAKERKELTDKLKAANDAIASQKKEFDATRESDLNDYDLKAILANQKIALPDDMPDEVKRQTALFAVNGKLPASAKWGRIDGKLAIVNKDGLPALDPNNVPYEASSFISGALAQQKLLKVNDGNPQPTLPLPGGSIPGVDKNQAARDAASQAALADYGFTK